jgi:NTE family protein
VTKVLVLGGGGVVGVAWEYAVLAGLLDEGVDLRDADLIIGTSAGSVVGAQMARGDDPRELMERRRKAAPPVSQTLRPDPAAVAAVFQLWGSYDEMTTEACASVGALALKAPTADEEDYLAMQSRPGLNAWPERPLLVCAVECATGEFRVFDSRSGVPLARAVAASCAVPGLFPPVTIEGQRYTDGGVRSWTSADLAMRVNPDRVLVIAPAGHDGPGARGLGARQMQREVAALRERGVDGRTIIFDDAAKQAGQNMMDAASADAAADAGRAHGRRLAAELRGWW